TEKRFWDTRPWVIMLSKTGVAPEAARLGKARPRIPSATMLAMKGASYSPDPYNILTAGWAGAVDRGNPQVGGASVKDDVEGLGRGSNGDHTIEVQEGYEAGTNENGEITQVVIQDYEGAEGFSVLEQVEQATEEIHSTGPEYSYNQPHHSGEESPQPMEEEEEGTKIVRENGEKSYLTSRLGDGVLKQVQYYTRKIPAQFIREYEMTRSDCPKRGVILVTRKSYRLCANPDDPSIENIMKSIDDRKFQ
ncbi:unnamed protein product, partial [Coregonus sp. 'balchen']